MAITNKNKDQLKMECCFHLAAAVGIVTGGAPTGVDAAATAVRMQEELAKVAYWADFIVEGIEDMCFAGDIATGTFTPPTP